MLPRPRRLDYPVVHLRAVGEGDGTGLVAVQIHFTVSDEVFDGVFEAARELGLSVNQYARIVFLANRTMGTDEFMQAQRDDLDRREQERRDRDEARRRTNRGVRRVDGGGYAR